MKDLLVKIFSLSLLVVLSLPLSIVAAEENPINTRGEDIYVSPPDKALDSETTGEEITQTIYKSPDVAVKDYNTLGVNKCEPVLTESQKPRVNKILVGAVVLSIVSHTLFLGKEFWWPEHLQIPILELLNKSDEQLANNSEFNQPQESGDVADTQPPVEIVVDHKTAEQKEPEISEHTPTKVDEAPADLAMNVMDEEEAQKQLLAEEAKKAAEALKLVEETQKKRLAEEAQKAAEEMRLAEETQKQRLAEEAKKAAEALKLAEEAQKKRLAEEARKSAEEMRLAEEAHQKQIDEAKKLAAEKMQQAEEVQKQLMKEAEEKAAEEKRIAEEAKQKQIAEEKQRAEEEVQKQQAEEAKRLAAEASAATAAQAAEVQQASEQSFEKVVTDLNLGIQRFFKRVPGAEQLGCLGIVTLSVNFYPDGHFGNIQVSDNRSAQLIFAKDGNVENVVKSQKGCSKIYAEAAQTALNKALRATKLTDDQRAAIKHLSGREGHVKQFVQLNYVDENYMMRPDVQTALGLDNSK